MFEMNAPSELERQGLVAEFSGITGAIADQGKCLVFHVCFYYWTARQCLRCYLFRQQKWMTWFINKSYINAHLKLNSTCLPIIGI